jgi:hypothetical protein
MSSFLFFLQLCVLLCGINALFTSNNNVPKLKQQIVQLARKVNRGLNETTEDRAEMVKLFEKLEKLNPNKNSLAYAGTSAVWNLEYTTSSSILGRGDRFKRVGDITQKIDTERLEAENKEVVSYFGINVTRSVKAELTPVSKSMVNVQFKEFIIADFLKIKAPSSFKGTLDITYVDNDLRLSRGDKGNIFVLTK